MNGSGKMCLTRLEIFFTAVPAFNEHCMSQRVDLPIKGVSATIQATHYSYGKKVEVQCLGAFVVMHPGVELSLKGPFQIQH